MALTRITKGVIKPNENYDTHNIVSTGIVTSVGLDVNGSADISGSLSVGGVLTYEDVTNIDSVGLITARSGIFVSAGSSVGIGTDDLTYPLEIHDSDPRIQLVDTDLASNRTVQLRNNQGSFVPSASQHTILYTGGSERVRIKSDGKVGIGTNDPQEELHILGSNPSIRIHTNTGTNVYSQLLQNGPNLKVRLRNDSSAGGMHIQGDDGTDITTLVRIQANGYVGIGTNTPGQPLEISNNSPGIRLTDTNSSAGAGTTSYTQIANINGNTYVYTRANQNNGNYLIGGHADGVFTERVRILQSGGVGINTTVLPYGQFAVDHGQYGLTRISNYSHLLLQNKNAGTTEFWTLAPRDNGRFGIGRGIPAGGGQISDEKFSILSNGKIGIGTVTPNENLDIQGTLAVGDNTIAVNRPRIILSAPYDGTYYRHLFGANLKVDSTGTFTTPTANVSGGGWLYHSANAINNHGHMIYMSAPDTNSTSSTPVERFRIAANGHVAIGTDSPNASLPLTIQSQYPGIQFRDNEGTSAFNINADANQFRIQTGNAGGSPTPRFVIKSDGRIEVTGDGHRNSNYGIFQVNQADDNDEGGIALLNDANTRSMRIYVDASGNSVINSGDGGGATLKLNEGSGTVIVGDNLLPDADNDQDLGSSSKRWANIYTADLQLSNKGDTNDVDGTWGQYTIQEGEDDLFLINKRNGKKYKFMLEEVN